jgi:hypothetical protein
MQSRKITSLFAVEGVPLGILHIHDCLRAGWSDAMTRSRIVHGCA